MIGGKQEPGKKILILLKEEKKILLDFQELPWFCAFEAAVSCAWAEVPSLLPVLHPLGQWEGCGEELEAAVQMSAKNCL